MTTIRIYPHFISAAFFLLTNATFAQDGIYKGVDAKGNIVYSNTPKGLQKSQKVQLPEPALTLNGAQSPQPQPIAPTPANRGDARSNLNPQSIELSPASNQELSSDRSSYIEANKALSAAINAQETGLEPLPSERLGTAGGGSRLSPAYFARQDALAKAVSDARSKLNAASGR